MAGTVVTAAVNNINIVNGTASLDVAAGAAVDVNANITVEAASAINQDVTSDASPTFTGETLSGLTASRVVVTDASKNLASGTNTDAQLASTVSASHTRSHAITGTSDHTSSATAGRILKADASGLPIEATNTDTDVADAVTKKHTQGTDTTLGAMTDAIDTAYATVASHATTSAIWAAAGNVINFTGTETITDLPAAPQAGAQRTLICAGACIWTHAGNLTVQGAANRTCVAGDVVIVTAITTTTFRINFIAQTETGSGSTVRATNPVLVGPALGAPSSGDLQNCTTDTASDNDSSTQIASTAFAKSQDAVLHREPDQGVAMTAAASGSTGITVADDDDIDFGTGNFALVWKGSLPDWTPSAVQQLCLKQGVANGTLLYLNTDGTLIIRIYRPAGTSYVSTVATGFVDGTTHEIIVVMTRETASVNGSVVFYADGKQIGDSVTVDFNVANAGADLSCTESLYIAGTSSARIASTVHHAYTLNFAPTAAEVLDMYRNGIPESWKWGSQIVTTLTNNGFETDTASPPNGWTNAGNHVGTAVADGTAPEGSNVVEIVASGAGVAGSNNMYSGSILTNNKRYRVQLYAKSISGNTSLKIHEAFSPVTITGDWVEYTLEATITTNALRTYIYLGGAGTARLDNIRWYPIGATLLLGPESWQPEAPVDLSSNKLTCTYPATGWTLTKPPAPRFDYPAVTAKTTAVTLTIAELLTLYITGTHAVGATQAYTLPTGALCDDWPAFQTVKAFEWTLANLSAAAVDTITLTADTGHTIVGNPIVQSAHATTGGIYGNSARFLTVKTAADTFETRRLA